VQAPLPQTTVMRFAVGQCWRAKSATAVPAFSIRVNESTPWRSLVARSMAAISAAVVIFIPS
jgi:hypothetical protein